MSYTKYGMPKFCTTFAIIPTIALAYPTNYSTDNVVATDTEVQVDIASHGNSVHVVYMSYIESIYPSCRTRLDVVADTTLDWAVGTGRGRKASITLFHLSGYATNVNGLLGAYLDVSWQSGIVLCTYRHRTSCLTRGSLNEGITGSAEE